VSALPLVPLLLILHHKRIKGTVCTNVAVTSNLVHLQSGW